MRIRVPVSMRNRLRKLERIEPRNLPVGAWPQILGVDEWEVLASGMQDALVSASRIDVSMPLATTVSPPPKERKADDGMREPDQRSAIDQLLAARHAARVLNVIRNAQQASRHELERRDDLT